MAKHHIAGSIGHLIPTVMLAGRLGPQGTPAANASLWKRALLSDPSKAMTGLGFASALTTPGQLGDRGIAFLSGMGAGLLGHTAHIGGTRLGAKMLSKMVGWGASRGAMGALGAYMVAPMTTYATETLAFGALDLFTTGIFQGRWEPWSALEASAWTMAALKTKPALQALRNISPNLSTAEMRLRWLENHIGSSKDPYELIELKLRGEDLAAPHGGRLERFPIHLWELRVAKAFADRGATVPERVAREMSDSPAEASRALAEDSPVLASPETVREMVREMVQTGRVDYVTRALKRVADHAANESEQAARQGGSIAEPAERAWRLRQLALKHEQLTPEEIAIALSDVSATQLREVILGEVENFGVELQRRTRIQDWRVAKLQKELDRKMASGELRTGTQEHMDATEEIFQLKTYVGDPEIASLQDRMMRYGELAERSMPAEVYYSLQAESAKAHAQLLLERHTPDGVTLWRDRGILGTATAGFAQTASEPGLHRFKVLKPVWKETVVRAERRPEDAEMWEREPLGEVEVRSEINEAGATELYVETGGDVIKAAGIKRFIDQLLVNFPQASKIHFRRPDILPPPMVPPGPRPSPRITPDERSGNLQAERDRVQARLDELDAGAPEKPGEGPLFMGGERAGLERQIRALDNDLTLISLEGGEPPPMVYRIRSERTMPDQLPIREIRIENRLEYERMLAEDSEARLAAEEAKYANDPEQMNLLRHEREIRAQDERTWERIKQHYPVEYKKAVLLRADMEAIERNIKAYKNEHADERGWKATHRPEVFKRLLDKKKWLALEHHAIWADATGSTENMVPDSEDLALGTTAKAKSRRLAAEERLQRAQELSDNIDDIDLMISQRKADLERLREEGQSRQHVRDEIEDMEKARRKMHGEYALVAENLVEPLRTQWLPDLVGEEGGFHLVIFNHANNEFLGTLRIVKKGKTLNVDYLDRNMEHELGNQFGEMEQMPRTDEVPYAGAEHPRPGDMTEIPDKAEFVRLPTAAIRAVFRDLAARFPDATELKMMFPRYARKPVDLPLHSDARKAYVGLLLRRHGVERKLTETEKYDEIQELQTEWDYITEQLDQFLASNPETGQSLVPGWRRYTAEEFDALIGRPPEAGEIRNVTVKLERFRTPEPELDLPETQTRPAAEIDRLLELHDQLIEHPARRKGLLNVPESQAKNYLKRLRSFLQKVDPKMAEAVDEAEIALFDQDFHYMGRATQGIEKALTQAHGDLAAQRMLEKPDTGASQAYRDYLEKGASLDEIAGVVRDVGHALEGVENRAINEAVEASKAPRVREDRSQPLEGRSLDEIYEMVTSKPRPELRERLLEVLGEKMDYFEKSLRAGTYEGETRAWQRNNLKRVQDMWDILQTPNKGAQPPGGAIAPHEVGAIPQGPGVPAGPQGPAGPKGPGFGQWPGPERTPGSYRTMRVTRAIAERPRRAREVADALQVEAMQLQVDAGNASGIVQPLPVDFRISARRPRGRAPEKVVEELAVEPMVADPAAKDYLEMVGDTTDMPTREQVVKEHKAARAVIAPEGAVGDVPTAKKSVRKPEAEALQWAAEDIIRRIGKGTRPRTPGTLRKILLRRKGIGQKTADKIVAWYQQAAAHYRGDATGRWPTYPMPADVTQILAKVAKMNLNPWARADRVGVGAVEPGSLAAKMLEMGVPEKVVHAVLLLREKANFIPPDINIKFRPGERGSFTMPFGRRRERDHHRVDPDTLDAFGKAQLNELTRTEFKDPMDIVTSTQDLMQRIYDKLPDLGHEVPLVENLGRFGGVEFKSAGLFWNKLRPLLNAMRKINRAPWVDELVLAVQEQERLYNIRRGTNKIWAEARIILPWREIRRQQPTEEAKLALDHRMVAALEGRASVIDPREQEIVQHARYLLDAYQPAMEAMGFPTRENYFPHIFKMLEGMVRTQAELVGTDAKDIEAELAAIQEVATRFARPRRSRSDEYSNDIEGVLLSYMFSVERMLAFRPLSLMWKDMQDTWGVQGSTNKRGKGAALLKKAEKEGILSAAKEAGVKSGPQIPASANEWWTNQMRIWNGTPGSIDKALYRFSDYLGDHMANAWNATAGRVKPGWKASTQQGLARRPWARKFMKGWMVLNYVGALGFSPGAALKNLTQNVPTIAEIGGKNWLWAARALMRQRTGDGLPEFHKLVEELGIYESSFTKTMMHDLEVVLKDPLWQYAEKFNELAFSMFSGSEWLLRGIAGMGAYRKMHKKLTNDGVENAEAHKRALSFGREMVRRTQFDYRRMLGPQAFSSETMKNIGQFARFQLGMTDYLQLAIRRGIAHTVGIKGGEAETIMPLMPGDKPIISMMIAAAGPYILGAVLWNALGVSMPDTESIGGPTPDAVQYPLFFGAQWAGEIIGDERGGLQARKIARGAGLSPGRHKNIWDAMAGSTGPAVGQLVSLGQALSSIYSGDKDQALKKLLPWGAGELDPGTPSKAPLPFPIFIKRIARYIEEGHTGRVRSAQGNRLFPEGRDLSRWERGVRLMGLQVRDLNEELELLSDRDYFKREWNNRRSSLRESAMLALDRGDEDARVVADIILEMSEIEDDFGVSFSGSEVSAEIKHIFKRQHERSRDTVREEANRSIPFRIVTDQKVLELLGGE
jgi:hypothetical protein